MPTTPAIVSGPPDLQRLSRQREWLWAFLLIALVFVSYARVFNAGFIWDDESHLTRNPCIVGPLGLKEVWTSARAVYYPLVLTTFWIVHKLVGFSPWPYHLLNVLLHAGSAVLLWQILRQLDVRGAWLGAALWALHPVMVQSVAWVTELKNTQSGFFYLLVDLLFSEIAWSNPRTGGLPFAPAADWRSPLLAFCFVLSLLHPGDPKQAFCGHVACSPFPLYLVANRTDPLA